MINQDIEQSPLYKFRSINTPRSQLYSLVRNSTLILLNSLRVSNSASDLSSGLVPGLNSYSSLVGLLIRKLTTPIWVKSLRRSQCPPVLRTPPP